MVELGNYTDSIEVFNKILTINENDTSTLNNKAIALSKLNLPLQSLELFYKSLLLDPNNKNTANNTQNIVDNLLWIDETSNTAGVLTIRDQNGNLVPKNSPMEIPSPSLWGELISIDKSLPELPMPLLIFTIMILTMIIMSRYLNNKGLRLLPTKF